jgi:hypothetical protein
MENRHPPNGIGLYIRPKPLYRWKRPIVLTNKQLVARRASLAKARQAACQAHVQVRLGTRPAWQVQPVPTKHRCTAHSKRTKQRCKLWALKKPGGGYFRVCWWHGGAVAMARWYGYRPEYRVINGMRMSARQAARYERKWGKLGAERPDGELESEFRKR